MTVNPKDLLTVREMIIAGAIKPLIDHQFSFTNVPKAIGCLEEARVCGKIFIQIKNQPLFFLFFKGLSNSLPRIKGSIYEHILATLQFETLCKIINRQT